MTATDQAIMLARETLMSNTCVEEVECQVIVRVTTKLKNGATEQDRESVYELERLIHRATLVPVDFTLMEK